VTKNVPFDDLVSFGREGLLAAARAFDESKGVPFRRWANLRVRGAMIDGLRQMGDLPKRVYRRIRQMEAADATEDALVEDDAARPPTTREQADERLRDYLAALATAMAVGTITAGPRENVDDITGAEITPEEIVSQAELFGEVKGAVSRLPAAERALVERHYFGGATLDEAAREQGLSKSWGSRLHARAIEAITRDLKRRRVLAR
jgi:RNA polymerase sigma factor for flagellar operon FliA